MTSDNQNLIAYLATLGSIVLLCIAGAVICIAFNGTEAQLAKVIAALGFVATGVAGLLGVIGTFRPKGAPVAATDSGDVNVNAAKE